MQIIPLTPGRWEAHLLSREWMISLETKPHLHLKEEDMPCESPGGLWKQIGAEPTCVPFQWLWLISSVCSLCHPNSSSSPSPSAARLILASGSCSSSSQRLAQALVKQGEEEWIVKRMCGSWKNLPAAHRSLTYPNQPWYHLRQLSHACPCEVLITFYTAHAAAGK